MNTELKILNINNNFITVLDTNNNQFNLNMEVHDIKLEVNDIILINNNLLAKLKSCFSVFGLLNDKYGKNLKIINSDKLIDEFIILYKNSESIYLKRLYG